MNYSAISSIIPPAAGSGTLLAGAAMGSTWAIMTGAALMTVSLVTLSLIRLNRGERRVRAARMQRTQ